MVKSPKTGRELGGEPGDKAPRWLRRVLDRLGLSAAQRPDPNEADREQ